MRLTLIRHAESEANRSETIGGRAVGLTVEGVAQASRLAVRVSDLAWDRLIASDLPRARQTVLVAFGEDAQPELDPRWREREVGRLEGTTYAEAQADCPGLFDPDINTAFYARPPGGESLDDLAQRVRVALADVMSISSGHVVVVTHGGPIRLAACLLLGLDPLRHVWSFAADNTAIGAFDIEDGHVAMMRWNDVAHLAGGSPAEDPSA